MDAMGGSDDFSKSSIQSSSEEDSVDLRRGPWTVEEDLTLINYITLHGEGRWNSLARNAGLKRTGKSCRLRWLNYLRPDVRRGNITLEEQLLILELHSRWGNRWSKIAQHLPGRTDNEIKNYWRTRVQKHAKQLKCDVNSKQFKDAMRYLWMPRLIERIQASAGTTAAPSTAGASPGGSTITTNSSNNHYNIDNQFEVATGHMVLPTSMAHVITPSYNHDLAENSSATVSSEHFTAEFSPPVSDLTDNGYSIPMNQSANPDYYFPVSHGGCQETLTSPSGGSFNYWQDFQPMDQWFNSGEISDNLWSADEDVLFTQQQSFQNNF